MILRRVSTIALGAMLLAAPGTLSAAPPAANVVFYDGNFPFDAQSRVLAAQMVPGYTTEVVQPYNGASVVVGRALPSSETGFTPTSNLQVDQVLNVPATVGLNQLGPRLAASYFGSAGGYDPVGVTVEPAGGVHQLMRAIKFHSPFPDAEIFYSVDGGPYQQWMATSELYVRNGLSLSFYGTSVQAGGQGVTRSADYSLALPPCYDTDGDLIPDEIELLLGRNPLSPNRDVNMNNRDDVDEVVRGILNFQAGSEAPLFLDTDGDQWSNYDENLRQTDPNNPDSKPIAPNPSSGEAIVSGTVASQGPGSAPPAGQASKPYPQLFRFDLVNPGGNPLGGYATDAANFALRVPTDQFRYVRARAEDGTGRSLLAVIPPKSICIDYDALCGNGTTLSDWREAYKTMYEPQVFSLQPGYDLSPRSTAVALLLNRYYELALNQEPFVPGVEGRGPADDLVQSLRGLRNETALFNTLNSGVTPAMVDVVNDYYRFWTVAQPRPMLEILADIFAGRSIEPNQIPPGVRLEPIAAVAAQADYMLSLLGDGTSVLGGTISNDLGGYLLTDGNVVYRLEGIADRFAQGTTVKLQAIVDANGCGFEPKPARVIAVLERSLAPLSGIVDTDGDGLDDDWEFLHFGDLDEEADDDPDEDGVSNIDEQENGTDPNFSQSDVFAGYQGDANLDMVVNALDMAIAQKRQGADYTCADCRGFGDANGSKMVDAEDLLSVGANIGLQYAGPASCSIVMEACTKSVSAKGSGKMDGNGTVTLVPLADEVFVGDTVEYQIIVDGNGSPLFAASVLIELDTPATGELLPSSINTGAFPILAALRATDSGLTFGGLAESDLTEPTVLGVLRVRAVATGLLTVRPDTSAVQTTFVDGDLNEFDTVLGSAVSFTVQSAGAELWHMY